MAIDLDDFLAEVEQSVKMESAPAKRVKAAPPPPVDDDFEDDDFDEPSPPPKAPPKRVKAAPPPPVDDDFEDDDFNEPSPPKAPPKSNRGAKPGSSRRCGKCGEPGHYARTCTAGQDDADDAATSTDPLDDLLDAATSTPPKARKAPAVEDAPVKRQAPAVGEAPVERHAIGTLYIDCLPLGGAAVMDISDYFAKVAAVLSKKEGVAHYRLVDYGKGAGIICDIVGQTIAKHTEGSDVFVSTDSDMVKACLDVLTFNAARIVKGLR